VKYVRCFYVKIHSLIPVYCSLTTAVHGFISPKCVNIEPPRRHQNTVSGPLRSVNLFPAQPIMRVWGVSTVVGGARGCYGKRNPASVTEVQAKTHWKLQKHIESSCIRSEKQMYQLITFSLCSV